MSHSSTKLFSALHVGNMTLDHRIVMAPMTRLRTDSAYVVGDATAEYYRQRSEIPGSLVITEMATVAPEAGGFPNLPGVYSDAQIAAWKKVVDVVHANGSYVFLQIGALGRVGFPEVLHAEGHPYVSSSPNPINSRSETPIELTKADIERYVNNHVKAAHAAVHSAGFDGVEIHACNGSLADQFIQDVANKRTDNYGGSIENRARYALEVIHAVSKAIGDKRVGVRFSPWSKGQGMGMVDPLPTFSYIISELANRHSELAYIHMIEPGIESADDALIERLADGTMPSNDFAYKLWSPRPYFTAGGYTIDSARKTSENLENTAIVIGRPFISNPDLPRRMQNNQDLTPSDKSTWYTPGLDSIKGYTDYHAASEVKA